MDTVTVKALEKVIDGLARAGAKHPGADPEIYGVETVRDVPYRATGLRAHQLDVYKPTDREGPLPVVLYVHGGGFRLMSKATHWMMAVGFARRGYLVFNVDYRLASEAPFPAALEDVSDAYLWTLRNAHRYGGDTSRLVVAGESAGANLVTSLVIQTSYRRDEPWAARVFDAGVQPSAVVGYCGIYEVNGIERLLGASWFPGAVRDWVRGIEDSYLGELAGDLAATELADPVRVLERGERPDRPLPPVFLSVGGDDVLLEDTHRIARALRALDVPHETRVYDGEGHAFQMLTWRGNAKQSWRETFEFLRGYVPEPAVAARPRGSVGERASRWVRDQVLSVMAA